MLQQHRTSQRLKEIRFKFNAKTLEQVRPKRQLEDNAVRRDIKRDLGDTRLAVHHAEDRHGAARSRVEFRGPRRRGARARLRSRRRRPPRETTRNPQATI